MTATTVRLNTLPDVVGYIAATVSKTLAAENFPGHDLETVMTRMTTDKVLGLIRESYVFMVNRGDDKPTAISQIGCRIIAEYYREFDLS